MLLFLLSSPRFEVRFLFLIMIFLNKDFSEGRGLPSSSLRMMKSRCIVYTDITNNEGRKGYQSGRDGKWEVREGGIF